MVSIIILPVLVTDCAKDSYTHIYILYSAAAFFTTHDIEALSLIKKKL